MWWSSIFIENDNIENQLNLLACFWALNKWIEKNGVPKLCVSLIRLSWAISFFMKTRFKGSYCKWSKVIIYDCKKCLYFVGLKNLGSDRQRIWSNHIFRFQTFVTQTFERSLGLIFDFVRKWKFWKSWKSFCLVSKFMDLE